MFVLSENSIAMKIISFLRLFVLLLICTNSLWAQEKKDHIVKVEKQRISDGWAFSCINTGDVQYEVTVTMDVVGLTGYTEPINFMIPAQSTFKFIELKDPKTFQERSSFSYTYSYKEALTQAEQEHRKVDLENALANKVWKPETDINKGITVFSKDGCPRCHFTVSYMMDNNVEFNYVNISNGDDERRLMWTFLKQKNPQLKTVTLPVIMVDGRIVYDIENLQRTVTAIHKSQIKKNQINE